MGYNKYTYKRDAPRNANTNVKQSHYFDADVVTELFSLETYHRDLTDDQASPFREDERVQNTICYRGHQFSYDPNRHCHSQVTINTGHWGPNVYPGCGRVRAGEMKYLEKCDYKSACAK